MREQASFKNKHSFLSHTLTDAQMQCQMESHTHIEKNSSFFGSTFREVVGKVALQGALTIPLIKFMAHRQL